MKNGLKVWSAAVALVMALALCAAAHAGGRAPGQRSTQQEQAQSTGTQQPEEIRTEYFTLPLGGGWRLLKPVQSRDGALNVMLGEPSDKGAIAINVMKTNLGADEIARNMRINMQIDGATVERPVAKNGFREFAFSRGKARGRAWVGANGRVVAVVTIFGDEKAGRAVMKKLQPKDPALFPKF